MMKMIVLLALSLTACNSYFPVALANENPGNTQLVGRHVAISLDDGTGQVNGTIVSITHAGVFVRLASNGKLYFYPMDRIFVIGEQ